MTELPPFLQQEFELRTGSQHPSAVEFIRLITGVYGRLYSLVISLVGSPQDAEDVLQDVCIVLWNKFSDFDREGNFGRWASGIALNVARNFLRKRKRRNHYGLDDHVAMKVAYVHQGTSELLELRRESLRRCLKKLSQEDRGLLAQVYQEEQAITDIAKQNDRTLSALYTHLFRLRKQLYDCVNRRLGLEERG